MHQLVNKFPVARLRSSPHNVTVRRRPTVATLYAKKLTMPVTNLTSSRRRELVIKKKLLGLKTSTP